MQALTLAKKTCYKIPLDMVDDVIRVDDCSKDNTIQLGKQLDIKHIIIHDKKRLG